MKKLLAICLSVLLICTAMPFAMATASTEPTIEISHVEAKAGETVEVQVLLKNNPGIVSAKIQVGYDSDVLELTAKPTRNPAYLVGEGSYSWSKKLTDNPYFINYCDGVAEECYTDELLVTMVFKIKDDAAPGTYPLTIVHNNKDFFNCAECGMETVEFGKVEGSVTVVADEPTPDEPVYTEPTIVLPELDVEPGETVEVPVLLKNNPGIVSAKIQVGYDSNVLELTAKPTRNPAYLVGEGSYSWSKNLTDNPYFINYCDGVAEECYTDEWLVTMVFKVKDDAAPGTYPLTVVYNNKDFFNCAECGMETVEFGKVEGSVTVAGDAPIVPPACEHEYDNACDVDCNLCGETREVTHNVVHVDAVAATCTENGKIEHWYCDVCGMAWLDAECTLNTNLKAVVVPSVGHDLIHMDPVAAGCHYIGNVEHWFCSKCDQYWLDAEMTQVTDYDSTIIPALGGEVEHVEAKDPTCNSLGNIEYWHCAECDQYWQNAELTQLTNSKNVLIGTLDHTIVHVEAKDPTCSANGNIEHWYCSVCEIFWQNAELTQITNSKNVIVPSVDHNLVHMEAKDAGCHYIGNAEYWYCSICNTYWLDAELTQVTDYDSTLIPALGGDVEHVEAKAPTCTELGNIEYWHCAQCNQYWQNAELTQLTNRLNTIIGMADHTYDYPCDPDCNVCGETREIGVDVHNLVHKEAVAPSCTENGNIEHWYCADCGMAWLDEACTLNTNLKAVILGATCATNAVYNKGVEAGCHYTGVVENWYCANCDVYYLDAACTIITNYLSTIIPMKGGDVAHTAAVAPGCHYIGNIEYWYCAECDQYWQDEALTQLTNSKNVILPALESTATYVPAVEPTCESTGNVEYWYCDKCEKVWVDEALTQLSNLKNVKIGVLDHNIVHIDAVAPGCHYNGNIEYWFCSNCNAYWQNEALTQLTNSKNVILPAVGGDVVHIEAVAPGCHYIGNIEYWFCAQCDQYWQDEALTQLTNSKNVILPALESTATYVPAKDATCDTFGNVEYWFCDKCEKVWVDEALTQLSNLKNVQIAPAHTNLVHMEAVEAACHYNGNVEYWICYDCGAVYTDEALTQVSNIKNVIIPAVGADVEHVEAKEPVGHENGNIEYWFCAQCDQYWQDEALTQLTNSKNVIVANPYVEYVVAVDPTATTAGNIAHWYCSDCGKYFSDGALTEELTKEQVIIPATGTDEPDQPGSPETGVNSTAAVLALLTLIASGVAVVVLKNKKHA